MTATVLEPACWSWPVPDVVTREDEIDRLVEEFLQRCRQENTRDHYLPESAARLLTRDWARYLMTSWHDGRCAICGWRPDRLVVDHHHMTGAVRGLLCRGCNISEGMRSADEVPAYALYRDRPSAAILTVSFYYVGRGWPDGWWRDVNQARALTGNPGWMPMGTE